MIDSMQNSSLPNHRRNRIPAAISIVGIYLTIGCLWIFFSDRLLSDFLRVSSDTATQLQTLKGWFYVIATAGLLYLLIHRETRTNQQVTTKLKHALTELQIAQVTLKHSEERFRSFMDNSPSASCITDGEGRMEYLSQTYLRMFQTPAEALGLSVSQLYPPKIAQIYLDNIRTVANTQQTVETIERGIRSDGRLGQFLTYRFPLPQPDGGIHVGSVAIDVTDLQYAQQELQSVYDSLNLALTATELGTWDLDLLHDTARRNLRHDQIFGYDTLQPEWGHEIAKRHVLPEDQPKLEESFQQALVTGELRFEVRLVWPDRTLHWIQGVGRVYYDEQHKPIRMAGVVADISDLKQAEAALWQSEEQLRLAFEFAQVGSWDWDLLTHRITWNKNHFHLLGLEPDTNEASYDNWRARIHPDDVDRLETAINEALHNHSIYEEEYRVVHPNGTIHWMFGRGQAIYEDSGQPRRMIGVLFDITKPKQIEELLRLREQQFRQAVVNAPYPMLLHAEDGEVVQVNQVWTEITGYDATDIPTISDWLKKAYGQQMETVQVGIERLYALDERVYEGEFMPRTKDGQERIWDFSSAPVGKLPDGRRLVLSMAADITDRKRAETSLRAALAEKEILLKEIHHRVKNNLQIISGLLQLQAEGLNDSQVIHALRESQNRIEAMSLIHKKLYTTSDMRQIDVADYIQSLAISLLTTYQISPGRIALKLEIEPVVLSLDQAIPCGLIINEVVSNALKYAFPHNRSGEINIKLCHRNSSIHLFIADNGIGMEADFNWDVLESLGLSLVHALVVEQLDGSLSVDSRGGTKFAIKFPDALL